MPPGTSWTGGPSSSRRSYPTIPAGTEVAGSPCRAGTMRAWRSRPPGTTARTSGSKYATSSSLRMDSKRPLDLRYAWPSEIDLMARAAGLAFWPNAGRIGPPSRTARRAMATSRSIGPQPKAEVLRHRRPAHASRISRLPAPALPPANGRHSPHPWNASPDLVGEIPGEDEDIGRHVAAQLVRGDNRQSHARDNASLFRRSPIGSDRQELRADAGSVEERHGPRRRAVADHAAAARAAVLEVVLTSVRTRSTFVANWARPTAVPRPAASSRAAIVGDLSSRIADGTSLRPPSPQAERSAVDGLDPSLDHVQVDCLELAA